MYCYYVQGEDGEEYGPVELDELREWVQENRAGPGTQVRLDEIGASWQPWEKFPELAALEASTGTGDEVVASFLLRAGGYLADGLILSVPMGIGLSWLLATWGMDAQAFALSLTTSGSEGEFQALFRWVAVASQVFYAIYFIARHGATPGMRIFRLRVVDANGQPPGLLASILRAVASVISSTVLGLGYLMAIVIPGTRTWHDLMARTTVLRRLPKPPSPGL